jgi:hypothetical protein
MNPVNRVTVVIKVAGKEVARRQVRAGDATTVELELAPRDVVTDDVVREVLRRMPRAEFRATTGGK